MTTLIKRCLERDRRRRVSSASTALFVIDEALAFPDARHARAEESATGTEVQAAVRDARRKLILNRFVPAIAALVLLTASGVIVRLALQPGRFTVAVIRFALPVPQTTLLAAGRRAMAISNDGAYLVYTTNAQLLIRPVSDFNARTISIADLGDVINNPVFSPR